MQAAQLRNLLVELYPAFRSQWESAVNLNREGQAFTPHGLCSEFSSFFVEQSLPLNELAAASLFREVEHLVASDPSDKDPVSNALCTCFLENIAQTPVGQASVPFMGPASLRYFEFWHAKP